MIQKTKKKVFSTYQNIWDKSQLIGQLDTSFFALRTSKNFQITFGRTVGKKLLLSTQFCVFTNDLGLLSI